MLATFLPTTPWRKPFSFGLLFLARPPVPPLTVANRIGAVGCATTPSLRGLPRQRQGTSQKITMPLINGASSQEEAPGPGPCALPSPSGQIFASWKLVTREHIHRARAAVSWWTTEANVAPNMPKPSKIASFSLSFLYIFVQLQEREYPVKILLRTVLM
jgi:hypothetical protein